MINNMGSLVQLSGVLVTLKTKSILEPIQCAYMGRQRAHFPAIELRIELEVNPTCTYRLHTSKPESSSILPGTIPEG